MKWKEPAVNRMLLVMIKRRANTPFFECSAESPKGRRSVCYDREGKESRKEHKPENNAIDMAASMGIELLTEEQYRELQKLGNFDTKTSSWVKAPAEALIDPVIPHGAGDLGDRMIVTPQSRNFVIEEEGELTKAFSQGAVQELQCDRNCAVTGTFEAVEGLRGLDSCCHPAGTNR
jgi:hypothetical protein